MTLSGINIIVTVLTMRAEGMTLNRLPIFVWGAMSAARSGSTPCRPS